MSVMTIQQRVKQLIKHHKGVRKAADALNMDPAYLSRLKSGEKQDPSALTLQKLGLTLAMPPKYEVTYKVGDWESDYKKFKTNANYFEIMQHVTGCGFHFAPLDDSPCDCRDQIMFKAGHDAGCKL